MGWDRTTLRKGLHELNRGVIGLDAVAQRERKALDAKLPKLAADLRAMGEATSRTDSRFCTTQLYRRLTAGEARRRLITEQGYAADTVPSERSLRSKLSALRFKPLRAAKSKPLRNVPQTDAIFEDLHRINREADAAPDTIRLSIDTKTPVPSGNLNRGCKSR